MNLPVKLLWIFLFFLLPAVGLAQEEEESTVCPQPENEKAIKLFEQGSNKKKYEKGERIQFLRKALELEPSYAEANFLLAEEIIKTAKFEGTSYRPALPYLEVVRDVCPELDTYTFYYLGQIAYSNKKFAEAAKYFKKFLSNVDAIKKDADYNDATELLHLSKEYDKIYGHPVPFDPKCLEGVNTKEGEYLPIISPDNEFIFFTRSSWEDPPLDQQHLGAERKQVEHFSVSSRKNGKFDAGRRLPPPFNKGSNYGGATVTPDNKKMYITVCQMLSGYMNCDIYSSRFVNGRWDSLINLGPNVNTPKGWESQPSVSADGKTLFFAALRTEGTQGMDILKSELQPDGTWGLAQNLGAPINTDQNEKSPFIHSDSQTLYYSSDGHIGMGGYDIFMVKTDSAGAWKRPSNLGYPINTTEDEVGFFVSTDGHFGYFASNTLKSAGCGGAYDIFYFDLYKEARPEKVVMIKGYVTAASTEDLKETQVEIRNTRTDEVSSFEVDSTDGKYVAIVAAPEDENLVVTISQPAKAVTTHLIKTADQSSGARVELASELKPIKPGETYRINDINFQSGSAKILDESLPVLDELIRFMKENPSLKIAVHGHTDDVGDDASNLALSTDRAFTVMEYLQTKGIGKQRLSFKGFGETKPVLPNTTDANRRENRRTEFLVTAF